MKFEIHTDGGSRGNPGPAASAFIVSDPAGHVVHRQGIFLGVTTNNQAEYRAVYFALSWLIEQHHQNSQLDFYLDSLLVVNQLSGIYKVKDPDLHSLVLAIRKSILAGNFSAKFTYIPRIQNFAADQLVNQTLDSQ